MIHKDWRGKIHDVLRIKRVKLTGDYIQGNLGQLASSMANLQAGQPLAQIGPMGAAQAAANQYDPDVMNPWEALGHTFTGSVGGAIGSYLGSYIGGGGDASAGKSSTTKPGTTPATKNWWEVVSV